MVNNSSNSNNTIEDQESVVKLKFVIYGVIVPVLVALGICGNILNLLTLRSSTLQSVPFMYIRAIAIFDLTCLIFVGFTSERFKLINPEYSYSIALYHAHVEIPLINTLLTASIYTALFLTVERLYLLCKPLEKHQTNVARKKLKAKFYIFGCLLVSTILHIPNCFERSPECSHVTLKCLILDSKSFWKESVKAYRMTREFLCRVIPVFLLAVLNIFIVRNLHKVNERRRKMLIVKPKISLTNEKKRLKSSNSSYFTSFTESRLTTMMMAITVIYVVGNIPQSVSTYLNRDTRNLDFSFQIFRAFANTMEICHHCLNFYVFCLTSQEYSKAFLRHCRNVKTVLVQICCKKYDSRRESLNIETSLVKVNGEFSALLHNPSESLALL